MKDVGFMDPGGGRKGGSPNAALFCHREGELTVVSLPERLVLKVLFYLTLRRQRGRRGTSCLTDRGTSEWGCRGMRGRAQLGRLANRKKNTSVQPRTHNTATVVKGDSRQLCSDSTLRLDQKR